eukprot:c20419_g1_i1.p1 GENE.c20419_g1_i1~~c20419_g1_i1.p1  ORF type:complete len:146 (+),score=37.37 c20419_g1_i1:159-596(+)
MAEKQNTTIFGAILRKEAAAEFVYEDEMLAVISDIKPSAKYHLLVLPSKEHIPTVKALKPHHVPMLQNMKSVALKLMQDRGYQPNEVTLVFHKPPFCSVYHLHLHVLSPDVFSATTPFKKQHKYKTTGLHSFWCVGIDEVIASLT